MSIIREELLDTIEKLKMENTRLLAECGHRAISIKELNRIIDDIEDWAIVSFDEPLLKLIKALKTGRV